VEHRFGAYRFDGDKRLLYRDGELVAMSPKALDVLAVLLAQRGEVIDKADLLRRAWPDTTVEEIGLARNISLLRKELGDWIETIPKKGYRFAGETAPPPAPEPPQRSSRRWWWLAAALPLLALVIYWQFFRPSEFLPSGKIGLAVANLEALGVPAVEAEKVRENLVTELAKLEGVQIVGPATVRRYASAGIPAAHMARILGLKVIVEGAVSGEGKTTLRLVDVPTGRVIVAREGVAAFVAETRKSLNRR
jgi:DNA-binding winged helix-turn-helix (wHTH) protein